jgi:hypothetical protein
MKATVPAVAIQPPVIRPAHATTSIPLKLGGRPVLDVTTHPELVNDEVMLLCIENPLRTDVDCSTDNKIEGAQQDCIDRARECEAFAVEDSCIGANLVRAEFLPERDACLVAPCEEFGQCLYDVIHGPNP